MAKTSKKNNAATPKKVKIQAESPMQGKNKPLKTPIKHKAPKSPGGVKKSPKPKIMLIPQDLSKNLNRRQKKRIVSKIRKVMQQKGQEDLSKVDASDPTVKEIVEQFSKKETKVKDEADDIEEMETDTKSPKKKPVRKNTPKKSPKTN